MPTTTRGAFPYPAGADNWKMLRTAIQALADRAAAAAALWRQSTAAARGNAGAAGTLHHASDTGAVSLDTGTAWLGLLVEGGANYLRTGSAAKVVAFSATQTTNASGDLLITFPGTTFGSAPTVSAIIMTNGGPVEHLLAVTGVSTTTVTLVTRQRSDGAIPPTGTSFTVMIVAIGAP